MISNITPKEFEATNVLVLGKVMVSDHRRLTVTIQTLSSEQCVDSGSNEPVSQLEFTLVVRAPNEFGIGCGDDGPDEWERGRWWGSKGQKDS